MIKSEETLFYSIEKTIKLYRRYAQHRLKSISPNITIDQLLVLSKIYENPVISHQKLSELMFKDMASISRILSLLEKGRFIKRKIDANNRRRFKTKITLEGIEILSVLEPVIIQNRKEALQTVTEEEIRTCTEILNKISQNIVRNED